MSCSIRKSLALIFCVAGLLCAAETPATWIDVPFVKQERNGCGAASIAMVMQYWQRQQNKTADPDANQAHIQQALYSERAHGIYASDMERYFAQHGFRAFAFRGEWSDLKRHVEKGRPLIVALKPSAADLHYVVVAGIDDRRKLVLVNDPAERKLLEREWRSFEREWNAAGNWSLLAVPRGAASER